LTVQLFEASMQSLLQILRYSARRFRSSLPRFGFLSGVVLVVLAMLLPSTASAYDSPTVWTQIDLPATGNAAAPSQRSSCAASYSELTATGSIVLGTQIKIVCNFKEGVPLFDNLSTADTSNPSNFCMISVGSLRVSWNLAKTGGSGPCRNNSWPWASAVEVIKGGLAQGGQEREVTVLVTVGGGGSNASFAKTSTSAAQFIDFYPTGGTSGGLNSDNSTWFMSNTQASAAFGADGGQKPRPAYSFSNLAPADECSGLTLTIADDTAPFLAGDTMSIEVDNAPANPVASVEIQMSPERAWQGVMAGQIGQVQTHTVTVLPGGTVNAADVVFRCVRSDGSIGYITYGDGVVASNPNARPCHLGRVSWPSASAVADIQPGDTFSVIVDMTGPWSADPLLEVESVDAVWVNLGPNAATIDVTVFESGPLAPGSRHTLDITVPAEFLPGTDKVGWSLELRCSDVEGSLTGYGSWSPRMLADILAGADVSCFSSTGLKLAPSSWVPGLLRGVVCIFQPSMASIGGNVASAVDVVKDKPPFVLLTGALGFGNSVLDGFDNSTASACFDAGPLVPPGVLATGNMCIGEGLDVSSGQRALLALIMVGPMYLGFVSHAVSLVREK
jgi:hypothetical protein